MTHTIRRGLEASLGLVVVTAAVVWLSGGCEERIAPGEVDVAARTTTGGEVVVVEEVAESGVEWASGEVASARHTAVSSRVLARIDEMRARAGSSVSEGDTLVVLDARDLQARVREAEEVLRSSEARLELARRDDARTQELFRTGVAPQSRLDEVNSALRAARADVAGQREALSEVKTAASFAEIKSPVTGRVVDRLAEPGDIAVPGRPLLRVYDPTLLRVEAPVRESLAVRLAVGDTLRVDVPSLGQPVEGRIDEIVPFAERGARTLLVKVGLPRTDARLFAGMFARVAIPASLRRRILVPERAIERVGQLEFLTVVDGEGGGSERRLVTTGERARSGTVEALSGVAAGERVWVPEQPTKPIPDAAREAAAAAIDGFRKQLGKALKDALETGPEHAIDVCRLEAPSITRRIARSGLSVGRTSQRLRNPDNAPEAWMIPLLQEFEEGAPAPGTSRTVDLGARGFGYVEPIYLQPLCATCHGDSIAPDLLARIREGYPDDQAVGFRVGEFRGLFWAVASAEQL